MFSVIAPCDCVSFGDFSLTENAKAIFKCSQVNKQLSSEKIRFSGLIIYFIIYYIIIFFYYLNLFSVAQSNRDFHGGQQVERVSSERNISKTFSFLKEKKN